jgi:hypothetical protein
MTTRPFFHPVVPATNKGTDSRKPVPVATTAIREEPRLAAHLDSIEALPCWLRLLAKSKFVPGVFSTSFGWCSTDAQGVTRILLREQRRCPCGRWTFFVVHMNGRGECWRCYFEGQQ